MCHNLKVVSLLWYYSRGLFVLFLVSMCWGAVHARGSVVLGHGAEGGNILLEVSLKDDIS